MIRSICILALALTACDPQDDCSRAAEFPAELTLGSGEKRFESLEDVEMLALEHGNQGGSHVWIALQTTGIVPGSQPVFGEGSYGPRIGVTLSYDGLELGHFSHRVLILKGNEAHAELTGLQMTMFDFDETDQTPVDWRAVTLSAELEDQCGTALVAEALVSVGNPN